MRSSPFLLVLVAVMLLLDFYVFQAFKLVTQGAAARTRTVLYFVYWTISVATLLTLVVLPYLNLDNASKNLRTTIFAVVAGLFFAKFTAAVFLVVDDLRRGVQWVAGALLNRIPQGTASGTQTGITRSVFFSWLAFAAGGSVFATLVHGFSNKYKYEVRRVPLQFANLPQAFKGLRIVQISDVHSGSFNDKKAVAHGVQKIMDLKPDLILFTGDLVNNKADEMAEYKKVFQQLQAPLGVFSVLGNHDYGDYVDWGTAEAKKNNLDALKSVHGAMGWKLLLNEHVLLERDGETIALLGIENWSAKARFPKYGKLSEAYAGAAAAPFKILMSHDPSHWDAEVRPSYADIDLMLSGHTHGMQFGVELPWFKWSPVQYVYKQWAGLYEEGAQKLYVNRGFGFLGYPGRVGILPEITMLELA